MSRSLKKKPDALRPKGKSGYAERVDRLLALHDTGNWRERNRLMRKLFEEAKVRLVAAYLHNVEQLCDQSILLWVDTGTAETDSNTESEEE